MTAKSQRYRQPHAFPRSLLIHEANRDSPDTKSSGRSRNMEGYYRESKNAWNGISAIAQLFATTR